MKITITKLTDVDLLRKAASMTTGKPSQITLKRAYALGHSLMRTQLFWVEMHYIPLSVASHLVRHVHTQPYQLSRRPDRGGDRFEIVANGISNRLFEISENPNKFAIQAQALDVADLPELYGRKSPTDLGLLLNAEEIINISRVRLCAKASAETRSVWGAVIDALRECDPDLFGFCVPSCVHQGFCREKPTCGYCNTEAFSRAREEYLQNFK